MNTMKGLVVVLTLVSLVVGCPDPGEVPPVSFDYDVQGTLFQDGSAVREFENMGQSANVEVSGPGVLVLDFWSDQGALEVDTSLEIHYKSEFGGGVLWVSLTEEGPVIKDGEKSAEELALLALVFLAGAVHVEGGVADCVGWAYPAVVPTAGGFQVEVPFSPAAKSVVARSTFKVGHGVSAKKFTHTVNLLGPTTATPTPTPFGVKIVKPGDGAVLPEGKAQLFAAEAESTGPVSWFWLFPDETVSSGSQVVAKMVTSRLAGEVSVIGTTPNGQVGWDTIVVTTTPEAPVPEPESRGVEITSPVAGTTLTGDSVHFRASLLGNEQPVAVEWYASGYHDTGRLDFSVPVSAFGLKPGTWNLSARVLVTFADGKTFRDEIIFALKVKEEEPPVALSARFLTPAEGAVLPLGKSINFKAEVVGGVAPYEVHWKFPDNDHRYNSLSVNKIFAIPDSEGYIYLEVKDATGASFKTQRLVRTAAS